MARAKALGFDVYVSAPRGFGPRTGAVHQRDDPAAFDRARHRVRRRRALGVRLIPSLQWNHWAFVDVCGESLGARMMRDAASAATAGTGVCVRRRSTLQQPRSPYKDVVYAWELGNELNLLDLDHASKTTGCAPALGTPAR